MHKASIGFIVIFIFLIGSFFLAGKNPLPRNLLLSEAVGVSASILSTPVNSLAEQLKLKEEALNEKEKNLTEREDLLREERLLQGRRFVYILLAFGFLSGLVGANFYFDYERHKKETEQTIT